MLSPRDKLIKTSWSFIESIRDKSIATVAVNLKNRGFNFNEQQSRELNKLIATAIEDSYHKSLESFLKGFESQ